MNCSYPPHMIGTDALRRGRSHLHIQPLLHIIMYILTHSYSTKIVNLDRFTNNKWILRGKCFDNTSDQRYR